MSRELKFRAYDPVLKGMIPDMENWIDFKGNYYTTPDYRHDTPNTEITQGVDYIIMQYTGRKSIKGRELYEGDIVFVEESEPDGDKRYYLVIVWIPEWAMFASLHMDEYHKFLESGYEVLDETLFWTYTLETSEKDFHYAGNIYENPELVTRAVGV